METTIPTTAEGSPQAATPALGGCAAAETVAVPAAQLQELLRLNAEYQSVALALQAQRDEYLDDLRRVLNGFTPIMDGLGIGEGKEPSMAQMLMKLPKLIQRGDLFQDFAAVLQKHAALID